MLKLSRHEGESLVINPPGYPSIMVTIIAVGHGGRVDIGIDAPRNIGVDRGEVFLQKAANRRKFESAAGGDPESRFVPRTLTGEQLVTALGWPDEKRKRFNQVAGHAEFIGKMKLAEAERYAFAVVSGVAAGETGGIGE